MPQLSTIYDNARIGVIRLRYRFDNLEMLHVDIILENNIRQVNNTWWGSGKKLSGVMRFMIVTVDTSHLANLASFMALWATRDCRILNYYL